MNPSPKGWPRLSPSLVYQDAHAAIAWLGEAFGFEPRLVVDGDGGVVEHSELVYGDALVMVADERRQKDKARPFKSPRTLGGVSATIFLYVDDIDAHCARARAAGAVIAQEPTVSDYGADYWSDKSYGCLDLEGHFWWFAQRLRG